MHMCNSIASVQLTTSAAYGFRSSKAMTNKQAERPLRPRRKKGRPRKRNEICPYCASCFRCPLPDCVIPSCQIVNLLPDGFVYRLDD